MTVSSYLIDLSAVTLSEQNGVKSSWVHALPIGDFKHPVYGTISVTSTRAVKFSDSVNKRVRGIDPSINYNHNNADVAAGWVKKGEARADGLWLFVEWIPDAAKALEEKKYRYFSLEFEDTWEDPQGQKFTDVVLGGALTNRPFMKNLVPINLSEETYQMAIDLVAAGTGRTEADLKGGNSVPLSEDDLKKIIEGVANKVGEVKPTEPAPTDAPAGTKLSEMPELKALAEENPLVKALIVAVERQNVNIASSAQQLKEADIARRLADFDRSKLVLTPVAKERIKKFTLELPTTLSDDFWEILTDMKRSNAFLVELGEHAGATVNYGSPKTAAVLLQEAAKTLMAANKGMIYADAYDQAANADPALYKRYRAELAEGVAN